MLDTSTKPFCRIVTKYFDWGQSYEIFEPIFETNIVIGSSNFEKSLHFFGENNFKQQLNLLHNIILNKDYYNLENLNEVIVDNDATLKLIENYIISNDEFRSPWEKYSTLLSENDFIMLLIDELNFVLCYATVKL